MSHEVDLSKYKVRTDLAIEVIAKASNLDGIYQEEESVENVLINRVVLNKNNRLDKKSGKYITIMFDDVTDTNNRECVIKVLSKELSLLIKNMRIKFNDLVLVIGLGNDLSTPDSLGPKCLDSVIVTNHLYILGDLDDGFRRVALLKPGVMGTTGMETSDIIKSVVKDLKPGLVIVIDSLASGSVDRVNKTIQLTDSGIHPGSGIGNSRKEISKDTLSVPVVAIGVPTVVDATTIVSDTINYMYKYYAFHKKNKMNKLIVSPVNYLTSKVCIEEIEKENLFGLIGKLSDVEIRKLISEVLTPIGYNLMVTPKEVDFVIEKLAMTISNSINISLHPTLNSIDKKI